MTQGLNTVLKVTQAADGATVRLEVTNQINKTENIQRSTFNIEH